MMWSTPPSKFVDVVVDDLDRLYRGFAITILNNLILRSPVDTGRYRANHILSFGAPDDAVRFELDKNGSTTLATGIAALSTIPHGKFPIIHIQNNLPYAEALEVGSSRQAPQGVYGLSFAMALAAYT